jgi:hypothetical protein
LIQGKYGYGRSKQGFNTLFYIRQPKLPLIESMSFILQIRGATPITSPRGGSPWTTKL